MSTRDADALRLTRELDVPYLLAQRIVALSRDLLAQGLTRPDAERAACLAAIEPLPENLQAANPDQGSRDVTVSFRLTAEESRDLRASAAGLGLTTSEVLRGLIHGFLEKRRDTNAP